MKNSYYGFKTEHHKLGEILVGSGTPFIHTHGDKFYKTGGTSYPVYIQSSNRIVYFLCKGFNYRREKDSGLCPPYHLYDIFKQIDDYYSKPWC